MTKVKTTAVVNSGDDASGLNAAIQAACTDGTIFGDAA
jgi:6-phosphofructokinase